MDPGGRPCYDGGISVGAQESSWTSWPWAEPSRPRGTPGTVAPAGSVSSATAQAVSWWPCWTLSPGPCLTFAQPPLCSSPFSIIAAPFNIPISPSLMSPGGLSSPPGSHPTLGHWLVQALCQTQKPHGSVCRVWPTSWTSEHARPRWQRDPGPRRSSLGASPQTWEAGLPLAMATRARGLTSVWPHRLPRRLESVKWARQPAWGGWLLAGGRQRGVGRGL